MPGNGMISMPPDIDGMRHTDEKLNAIKNYLYLLIEQMRYTMANLGADNFNDTEMDSMAKTFTKPLSVEVRGLEGDMLSMSADVNGMRTALHGLDGRMASMELTMDGLNVTTSNGTTFISGNHIKSGKIEGVVLSCVMGRNKHESEGKINFFYQENSDSVLVGGIRLSDEKTGVINAAQHKLLISSHGRFALKLQAETNSSYESLNGNIYIHAREKVQLSSGEDCIIIVAPNGMQYSFENDGIHFNGRVI